MTNAATDLMHAPGVPGGKCVIVQFDDGIAWITLNRPDKRNAMSPDLHAEMVDVLEALEIDDRCGVLVFTGAGNSFSAGMDLKEFFRAYDDQPPAVAYRARRKAGDWMWKKLMYFPKPTIAMVNGYCFGGAFTPVISCDLAIAADEAEFGLSEINWGIFPSGVVTRAVDLVMNHRDGLFYTMTGRPFDGKTAAKIGLINQSVPLADLRATTEALARELLQKNPVALRIAKQVFKRSHDMPFDLAEDYLLTKKFELAAEDAEGGREKGMSQFLDEKSVRPGKGSYRR